MNQDQRAEYVAKAKGDEPPRCDHICMLDEGHVERGERHQYGYELPSPRMQAADYVRCCGKVQVAVFDKLHRFGFLRCNGCGREFGQIQLVYPSLAAHSAPEQHPDDYDACDCRGLEEHARAMGTWPHLAIPKEPYGDGHAE